MPIDASVSLPAARREVSVDGRTYQRYAVQSFEQFFKRPLADRGLEGILKDREKARGTLDDLFGPAIARNSRH